MACLRLHRNNREAQTRPGRIALAGCIAACALLAAHAGEPGTQVDEPAQASYGSAEAAFRAVFLDSGLGERAYREDREYAAALYEMPDGSWRSTPVIAGERGNSLIPYHLVPAQARRIAGAHSHGSPLLPGDPDHVYGTDFSRADRRNAWLNFRASGGRIDTQLLLSSELKVLRLRLNAQGIELPTAWYPDLPPPTRTEIIGALPPRGGPASLAQR